MKPANRGQPDYQGDQTALMAAAARGLGLSDGYSNALARAADAPPVEEFPDGLVDRVIEAMALRTQFIDDIVKSDSISGTRQVVVLGSGLDTRPWRLSWPHGSQIWHVDRHDTVSYASQVLPPPAVDLSLVSVDLVEEDWREALLDRGYDDTLPTLFVAEAVLLYLDAQAATDVVTQAAEIAGYGSSLVFTYAGGQGALRNDFGLSEQTARMGAPFRSSICSPEHFLRSTQWDVMTAVTYEAYSETVGGRRAADEGGGISWLCHAVLP